MKPGDLARLRYDVHKWHSDQGTVLVPQGSHVLVLGTRTSFYNDAIPSVVDVLYDSLVLSFSLADLEAAS